MVPMAFSGILPHQYARYWSCSLPTSICYIYPSLMSLSLNSGLSGLSKLICVQAPQSWAPSIDSSWTHYWWVIYKLDHSLIRRKNDNFIIESDWMFILSCGQPKEVLFFWSSKNFISILLHCYVMTSARFMVTSGTN